MQHDHILIKLGALLVEGLQGDASYQRMLHIKGLVVLDEKTFSCFPI